MFQKPVMLDLNFSSLNALQNQLKDSKSSLVLNFTASWAEQCTQVTDALKVLEDDPKNKSIQFANVDAESVAGLSKELKITSVPTVVLFHHGSELSRVCGSNIAEITKAVTALQSQLNVPTADQPQTVDLETRLRSLITRAPIMLFMKGKPSEPRCGFSRQIVDILKSVNAQFDSFDILQDAEVRQGLKTLSNWPTYPQLYVKGELIGGLDIVKELAASGELIDTLKV